MRQIDLAKGTNDYEQTVEAVNAKIECELFLFGCSVVEDKLQDEVPSVIKDLIDVNIKVWMLTGDKMETAENIALSCKLIQPEFEKLYIKNNSHLGEELDEL